jgi:hypothetical protein
MKLLIRASCLGYRKLALTPALSPRRGGIVARWFGMTNRGFGSCGIHNQMQSSDFLKHWRTILPLPAGEGRGEGEPLVQRFKVRMFQGIVLLAALLAAFTLVPSARAVVTQKVTDDTYAAFSKGDFKNISLTSDGHLELAPTMTNVASVDDPIIWATVQDKKGNLYIGTGNQGKVYKLTPKGELTTFFEPNAVMVHALAIDDDDRVYAATSPNGCVYRLSADGSAEVYCNPHKTYIWAMVFGKDGSLYLATGSQGEIMRARHAHSLPVEAENYFNTKEDNITALTLDKDGSLLAGSSPHGYVYRIDRRNHGFVLFNSGDKEIKQIAVAPDGVIYVSTFVSNPKSGQSGEQGSVSISLSQIAEAMGGGGGDSSTGNAVTSALKGASLPTMQPLATATDDGDTGDNGDNSDNSDGGDPAMMMMGDQLQGGSGESEKALGAIYRIATNGLCERYWSVPGEAIYSMALLPDGTLLAGTGNQGRIYSIADENHWKLVQDTGDGAQVAALLPDTRKADCFYAATSEPGNVYRLDLSLATDGTWTSAAFDAKQKSQWGRLHPLGDVPAGTKLELATRSGNTKKVDGQWSDWSASAPLAGEIPVTNPEARYLQYRVKFERDAASPGATACLRRMEFYYQNINAPPVISRVTVHTGGSDNGGFGMPGMPMPGMDGQPPNAGQMPDSGGFNPNGQNPGAEIMAAMMQPPMRMAKNSGSCIVIWKASDPNDDDLVYSISIRAESDKEWTTLVDKTRTPIYSFNTLGFREGYYVVKVTASDLPSNTPETARTAEAISEPFLIDNASPTLAVQSQSVKEDSADIVVSATDAGSIITSASYSLDGKEEVALRPEDLIFDSTNATLDIKLSGLSEGAHSLLVHAQDEAKNTAVLQLNFEAK